jgi:ribosomal protein S18 acetylase RimI-like enzyme
MISYHVDEEITFEEYVDFLKRTDLGSQYPAERFKDRMSRTLRNRSVAVTARDQHSRLVGACFGLTDFAYFLFITDLGVDRNFERRGIGTELLSRIHAEAGGGDDISVVTVANDRAIQFYEARGFRSGADILWLPCKAWTKQEIK